MTRPATRWGRAGASLESFGRTLASGAEVTGSTIYPRATWFLAPAIATGRVSYAKARCSMPSSCETMAEDRRRSFGGEPGRSRGTGPAHARPRARHASNPHVLDAMRRSGVKGLVLASSATVYGLARSACRGKRLAGLAYSITGEKLASEALAALRRNA